MRTADSPAPRQRLIVDGLNDQHPVYGRGMLRLVPVGGATRKVSDCSIRVLSFRRCVGRIVCHPVAPLAACVSCRVAVAAVGRAGGEAPEEDSRWAVAVRRSSLSAACAEPGRLPRLRGPLPGLRALPPPAGPTAPAGAPRAASAALCAATASLHHRPLYPPVPPAAPQLSLQKRMHFPDTSDAVSGIP